ncbi:MAG TPA: tetratricopeptide repeat protein [Rhizomicrobium sp.]|nr:tetratricopeptide repeat protein [Rhizomicrobium sp.]
MGNELLINREKGGIAMLTPGKILSWVFAVILGVSGAAKAQQPKPIDKVQGVTGRFQVILTERSPLSNATDIAKHTSQKAGPPEPDYDLPKEIFEAYVPKAAGDGGKYGLMVPMPMPNHGFPPAAWLDVLEKHHLIWLGDQNGGINPTASIGLALDAVHNAEKTWPIDPARVYICPAGTKSLAQGIALYYPEIFQGQLCSAVGYWFDKVTDIRTRRFFNVGILNQPTPAQLTLAKSRTRNFFAGRESPDPAHTDLMQLLGEQYTRAGFKHVKYLLVPQSDMTLWTHYPASWFEQGVEFLDAGATEANAPSVAATPATAAPKPAVDAGSAATSTTPTPATPTPDDGEAKASAALRLAKSYINAAKYDTARAKLQALIQSYPKTASATEAKSLLAEIKDK